MKFGFFFETKESFTLKVWANHCSYRWESGGAFGSGWSEKQWYEGIAIISKQGVNWYFFFKTYEVRDAQLPPIDHQMLFGDMSNSEILDKFEKSAKPIENSPFPFMEIGKDFVSPDVV